VDRQNSPASCLVRLVPCLLNKAKSKISQQESFIQTVLPSPLSVCWTDICQHVLLRACHAADFNLMKVPATGDDEK
jgi:hypothetical protein